MLRPDTFALTALLALLTALGPVAVDMYLPSFPEIGRLLGASPATVQLTLSLYMVAYAVGQIVYGPLSDRFGRIPVLRTALAIYCAASLACALAPTIETLLAARALQALGSSGAIVLARAIVRDLYSGARAGRELSLMGAIMALAPVGAPMIGGVLQSTFGWRSHFVLQIAFGLVAAFFVWRKLPETLRAQTPGPFSPGAIWAGYREIMRNRAVLAYIGMLSISFAGVFAWISGSSFVLQEIYGLSALQFGLAFAAGSCGYLAGTALAAYIVTRLGLDRTIGIGAAGVAGGGLAAAAAVAAGTSAVPLVAAFALYATGMGMVQPQTIAGAMMPFPHRAGTASSLVGVSQMVCAAIIGAIVGHLLGASAWPVAVPLALTGVTTLVLWAISRGVRARAGGSH
ncbi:MAG TPA: multidrug effflux MFS transporter [Xanthobacteraceae bacterium]|nr:multidrug effflux MFS transporter [Xanthobacteraceae bacterium]